MPKKLETAEKDRARLVHLQAEVDNCGTRVHDLEINRKDMAATVQDLSVQKERLEKEQQDLG
jgi:hypothetical protein